jgi:putative nucleotidyltransferase with HDIG domain
MTLSEISSQARRDIPDTIIQEVSAFPNMPQTGIKLRALLSETDVAAEQIERILRHDPGLAANVLRLANSAFFGIPTKVSTLKHAVVLLGVKRFAQIAVSACMSKTMGKAVEGYGLSPGALWLHSIAVSTIAEALAKNRKLSETSDFFTPALLHDLGKLVLGEFVKAELPKITELVGKDVSLVIAEKEVLGTDHAEIGALILHRWRFPPELIDAVRWHHDPDGAENSNLHTDVVYLANLLCQTGSGGDSTDVAYNVPNPSALDHLGIKPEQFAAFAEKARSWMDKLSDTLAFE